MQRLNGQKLAVIWGKGPTPCRGMIVGEAPGAEEEKHGEPFIGVSGKLLEEALAEAELTRDMVYITNVYKCRPPGNRTPTDAEVAQHAMYLHKEIKKVSPICVLTLGVTAVNQFISLDGLVKNRGKLRRCGDFFILPTLHPAYVLRQRKRKEEFFDDVKKFKELAFDLTYERDRLVLQE